MFNNVAHFHFLDDVTIGPRKEFDFGLWSVEDGGIGPLENHRYAFETEEYWRGEFDALCREIEDKFDGRKVRVTSCTMPRDPNFSGPEPGTWAATAAMMADGDDSGFDWDAWKDEMKEADLW